MKKDFFTVGQAAAQVRMTSETLRHYDRVGLVKPSRVDEATGYRYYSAQDIVRLNTVHALRQMDLPLGEIKRVLAYDDLEEIVRFLERAERQAGEKIAALEQSRAKIRLARADYEKKLHGRQAPEGVFTQALPERAILLAGEVGEITADDLWDYHRHFYSRLPPEQRPHFAFEDLAGVCREGESARYFAVCTRCGQSPDLQVLPAGLYLCADCDEGDWQPMLGRLMSLAGRDYGVCPRFSLQLVVISGILQWRYQLQVLVREAPPA